MREAKRALHYLDELDLDLWHPATTADPSPLLVDLAGTIWIRQNGELANAGGQAPVGNIAEYLELLSPYAADGHLGPDLLRPRAHLRIVPLVVAGEPHVYGSRVTSRSLAALGRRGLTPAQIADMYELKQHWVEEVLDLERQLANSERPAA